MALSLLKSSHFFYNVRTKRPRHECVYVAYWEWQYCSTSSLQSMWQMSGWDIRFLKAWNVVMIISKTGKINTHRPNGMLLIFNPNAKMKYETESNTMCILKLVLQSNYRYEAFKNAGPRGNEPMGFPPYNMEPKANGNSSLVNQTKGFVWPIMTNITTSIVSVVDYAS